MECPNCGYDNPDQVDGDNRCDECGNLLTRSPEMIATDFSVVATSNNSVEAALNQTILEEQGIKSWLKDDATVSNTWYLTIAVGGIKICVNQQDAEAATAILDEYHAASEADLNVAVEDEDEKPLELNPTDKTLRNAFRAAVLGLFLLPLQLYSLWLLFTLLWKGLPRSRRQISTLIITLGLNLALLIVVMALFFGS